VLRSDVTTVSLVIGMHRLAESFLGIARSGAEQGYAADDETRVRNAAERAWQGALQATDAAMARYGLVPEPGPRAQATRLEFLEAAGRRDLAMKLKEFEEALHGRCFYWGEVPDKATMAARLDEVAEFIRAVTEGT
jgi:hypothetical protein